MFSVPAGTRPLSFIQFHLVNHEPESQCNTCLLSFLCVFLILSLLNINTAAAFIKDTPNSQQVLLTQYEAKPYASVSFLKQCHTSTFYYHHVGWFMF